MKKVLEFIRQQNLIEKGDHVIAGVSGGADSVYLLFVLLRYRKEQRFDITVVHVNHNLRGAEAGRDARYVRELCGNLDLPFVLISADVKELAEREKISTEEAGRLARYEAFARVCRERGGTKIALAHHQNDLAETMIYHLARGTGMKGLAAILPRRRNVVRPLLCMKRQEIEHDLKEMHIEYVTDSTNEQDDYTRNRIRHHVIDYLTARVNEQTVSHMAETAGEIGEVQSYLEKQAEVLLEKNGREEPEGWLLDMALFSPDIPVFLQNMVIGLCVQRISGSRKDFTRIHHNQVRELSRKSVGKQVNLPRNLTAVKDYAGVRLFLRQKEAEERRPGYLAPDEEIRLLIPGRCRVGELQVSCTIEENNRQIIPEKTCTKWLNYDKIKDTPVFRNRRPGDYLVVNQSGGRKKLKDYLIDRKVPREERDHILLLCVGSEVLWVCGHRISEAYKVYDDTEFILKVQIQGGTVHE